MNTTATTALFVVTYLWIAWPHIPWMPIGRPAAALFGAVTMVIARALTPEQAYRAIDGNTLVLLFALMALSGFLEQAGVFKRLSELATASQLSAASLLMLLVLCAGAFSALLLNDAVCLFLTPVVCHVCATRGLPFAPYLLALATSSNIGSAATLVGNPQNILIASIGPLDFLGYARIVAPATLVALLANALLLWVVYRRELLDADATRLRPQSTGNATPVHYVPILVAALVVVGFALGFHLAFTTLAGVVALVLLSRREPHQLFRDVDWPLLVFFAALFIVVAAFGATGFPERAWELARPHLQLDHASGVTWFSAYTTIGSNLFSNVPLVMLTGPLLDKLGQPERAFALLGYVSTVAGNLTLLGSVANLIVAERAREHYALGFMQYLRFGVVSTLVSLVVGVPVVCLLTR